MCAALPTARIYTAKEGMVLEPGTMHYGISTRLPPEKVIEKAVDFFGKLGLEVKERDACTLLMEGGGGYIDLSASAGKETDVDIVTQEWNAQVKQFLQRIS